MTASEALNIEQGTYVQANGLRMYYETHGVGIPVILLHGGLETCKMWAPAIASLSENFQVITPDSRGHGRTDNPSGEISYPLMAADIAALIQNLGLHKPFVVGYSDGGQTALEMAMTYPGLTRRYMIGAVYLTMTEAWFQFLQGLLGFLGPGNVDIERIILANPSFVRDMQERHDTFHAPGYWQTLLTQISIPWMNSLDYSPSDFTKIFDPTLLWCGDRDVFCPPEQVLEMYRNVTNAELAVIPNADHFSMEFQFDLATTVLINFMMRIIRSE